MDIHEGKGFQMLPPGPGKCPVCAAAEHGDEVPHNRDSLFYQFWFSGQHGRSPTWSDASLLCGSLSRRILRDFLLEEGVESERIGDFSDLEELGDGEH